MLPFQVLCAETRTPCTIVNPCVTIMQVVDFFGFGLPDIRKEMMSMHHTHDAWGSLVPKVMYVCVMYVLVIYVSVVAAIFG